MSSGNFHEEVNKKFISFLFICLIFLGIGTIKPVLACVFFLVECILFWLHGMFHTYYVTPDNDTDSKSTKRLWILGDIINFIFPHHGLLHDVSFWVGIYFLIGLGIWIQFHYVAWWLSGGVGACLLHLFVDGVSTRKRRLWGKVKRKLNPFNWI